MGRFGRRTAVGARGVAFQTPYPAQVKSHLGGGMLLVWALQPGFPKGRELRIPAEAIPPGLRAVGSRFMMAFFSGDGELYIRPLTESDVWPEL